MIYSVYGHVLKVVGLVYLVWLVDRFVQMFVGEGAC